MAIQDKSQPQQPQQNAQQGQQRQDWQAGQSSQRDQQNLGAAKPAQQANVKTGTQQQGQSAQVNSTKTGMNTPNQKK